MMKRTIGIGGAGILSLLLLAGCLGQDAAGPEGSSLRRGGGDTTTPEDSIITVEPNPDRDQVCTAIYREVCGTNGITYHLTDGCQKAPVPVAHEGACGNPKDVPDPIDDSDVVVIPDPDDGWACIALYDPVCGVDGKTYGNLCEARKTTVAHKGECIVRKECPPGMACIN